MSSQAATSKKRLRPSTATIEEAVREVLAGNQSINKTALAFGISRAYLAKIVKKAKNTEEEFVHRPNIGNKRIFSKDQEDLLVSYLKTASKMCHGLTKKQTRQLAFQYAEANNVCPEKWKVDKIASVEWLRGFMTRHKDLSVRKPENTSLSRATSFNKTNVGAFFEKLTSLYEKFNFPPHMIFNTDETGCSTVSAPPKIIAEKGSKQIGQVTSAERGTLVTTLFYINAAGGSIPPVFIFPRVNYKDHMLNNGPSGALGLAHVSGWMTENNFMKAMEHFASHVKPTAENPALLILDNHASHVNLRVIEFARQNFIKMLTFPPHCSHRLQPLDVTVYGPFKTRYRIAMNEWMLSNPGKTVTIYQVAQFVRDAYLAAFSMSNITQGFIKTGIYPLNSKIFTDDDFLTSYVTDRPDPTPSEDTTPENLRPKTPELSISRIDAPRSPDVQPTPTDSLIKDITSSEHLIQPSTSQQIIVSPQIVRPFLKSGPRKNLKSNTRKMTSAIITDTPEKNKIEEKETKSKTKKNVIKKMKTTQNIRQLNTKNQYDSSESSDNMPVHDDTSVTSSDDDINLSELKKKNISAEKNENYCVVCKKHYANSKEEWYQCKICGGWAHESCGHKGVINFFCQKCF